MIEHFEIAQESRSCLRAAELCQRGRVIKLTNAQCECPALCAAVDRSKFIRLSSEFSSDLEGPQLETLSSLCLVAHDSEEFFLSVDATDQWLRTAIGHENLHPRSWAEAETWIDHIPSFIIHSNILPYDPYWSKPPDTRDEARPGPVHFPSYVLKEALDERKTLKTKLLEWSSTGNECKIAKHGLQRSEDGNLEQPRTSKLVWEIKGAKLVKVIHEDYGVIVSLIRWRGGWFIRKEIKDLEVACRELEVMKRFSHPHIVYSFGELCDEIQSSCFMEYMSNDLYNFIIERARLDPSRPPFSRYDSVDVLSQVARAMRHMHQENVNVVHCDLKSGNILISEFTGSDNKKHYLVKVADFGSALSGDSSSSPTGFIPGRPTKACAAPEVLGGLVIRFPHKIDVYSFGIVAFEVLTGKNMFKTYEQSPSTFKRGVMAGTLRPPLLAECKKLNVFTLDKDLLMLIESCWDADPCERPSFVEICAELNKIRDGMLQSEQMLQGDHPAYLRKSLRNLFLGAGKQKGSTSRNPN